MKATTGLLGLMLQQQNLLAEDTKISVFRKIKNPWCTFYDMVHLLCVCLEVDGPMEEL
jgi:hypothetical protein